MEVRLSHNNWRSNLCITAPFSLANLYSIAPSIIIINIFFFLIKIFPKMTIFFFYIFAFGFSLFRF